MLVGDDSGQIGCYEFKNGERQVVFMAKPFEGPVTSVELGGNPKKRDKVNNQITNKLPVFEHTLAFCRSFYLTASELLGIQRKGKNSLS